ncbi:mevalonate kinase-like [Diaphorina citri]|uniref:Mevalonate kinase-like n=1 Tax=Diaphorina citri TaxID=121845 RepID=A0A3Q0JD87_DIACI|nr:mevalonate kinase-like [Diaphorina citri]
MMNRKIGDSPAIQNAMNVITFLLASMLSTMNVKLNTGLMLTISSELVLGAGSGSSASFAVSVAGTVYTLVKWLLGDVEDSNSLDVSISDSVNKWAFLAEQITHGKPSGLDNAVCTWGGLVKLKKLPLSTEISNVLWMGRLEILLIDTGHGKPSGLDNAVCTWGGLVKLKKLPLSTEISYLLWMGRLEILLIDTVIDICKGHDLHAKLTGAGGGGYAYALVPPYARGGLDACVRELERARYTVYRDIQLGGQGFELKIDRCYCVGLKDKVSL